MHFFDGSVVPLDPSAEIVLHWVSKDYLGGMSVLTVVLGMVILKLFLQATHLTLQPMLIKNAVITVSLYQRQSKLNLVVVNDMNCMTQV